MEIETIKKDLEKGFSARNLHDLTVRCIDIARSGTEPVVFYVLASIFCDIHDDWQGQVLTVDDAGAMEQKIMDKILSVLDTALEGKDRSRIWDDLNKLVSSFLQ
jgi:hypothetical protein